jgi:hypothetical protein
MIDIFYLGVFVIFLFHVYEDYQKKSISFLPMIISIGLMTFRTPILTIIYLLMVISYFVINKFYKISNHLGFGDLWYICIFSFYFHDYIYILFLVAAAATYWQYKKQDSMKETIPLLPSLLIAFILSVIALYFL